MKKTAQGLLFFLLALLTLLPGAAWAAQSEEPTLLTVGVPPDRCPLFYTDPDTGELTGIGVELMREVAIEAGYRVKFRLIEEENLKDALDSPAYDVLLPFGSALPSTAGVPSLVTENLMQTPFTLVMLDTDRSISDLASLRVGMLRSQGAVAETVKAMYPGIDICLCENMEESVETLRAGRVDALLQSAYIWSYVLQKPAYSDLRMNPSSVITMDFRAGTPEGPQGEAIVARLNRGIAALPEARRTAILLDFTTRQLYRYDVQDYIREYGPILVLILLALLSLAGLTFQRRRALLRQQEERLAQLIDHDPLTGALSLNGFRKRVEELLQAHPDIPYVLAFNNITNFKFINSSQGMAAGDELLKFWTKRTQSILSPVEAVGRLEADHFAVLRRIIGGEVPNRDDSEVFEPVRNYFVDRGKGNRLQLCSGVYVLTREDYREIDVDHMLDYARVAEKRLHDTRAEGIELYNPEQWERGKRIAEIVGHLPIALRDGEVQVWYQPQVDFPSGDYTGAEALCRWKHGRLGWLSPAEFIPILEEAGLIFDLDCYVWEQVCKDLDRWNRQGERRYASVNLSRYDIAQERDIPDLFQGLITTYALEPDQLRIEVTESAYVENPDLLIRTLAKLRRYGFPVEMDDFGSGYSSLNMLQEVPVDRIKLDLHFLNSAGDPERGRIIVAYMIQMVHSLGMSLIAEGVETDFQAQFLRSHGCIDMQGYFFSKPVPVEELERLYTVHHG